MGHCNIVMGGGAGVLLLMMMMLLPHFSMAGRLKAWGGLGKGRYSSKAVRGTYQYQYRRFETKEE
jgi:hypothetical protein